MKRFFKCMVLCTLLGALMVIAPPLSPTALAQACGDNLRSGWIDTHVHPNGGRGQWTDFPGSIAHAASIIQSTNISRMVLMPNPQIHGESTPYALEYYLDEARKYPDCFAFMGGGGTLNSMIHQDAKDGVSEELKAKFTERAEQIVKTGAIGFGELSIVHLSLLPDHEFQSVPADHPLLLLLADIAAKNDMLIDFHYDAVGEDMKAPDWLLVPPNPSEIKENLKAFERLLEHNRGAKIMWAHFGSDNLGFWTVDLTRRLLKKHPNLYMSIRSGRGQAIQNHLLKRGGFKPGWIKLLREFSDRFVLGGDQFFVSEDTVGPSEIFSKRAKIIRKRMNIILKRLPDDLKRKIGYENAIRLYKLDSQR
jgi:predicted TIM-barrel fold metal-dependent hydrolase